ncbi:MAG: hypothetical protein AAGJ35_08765, partial [Myxococcota bacterium]
MAEWELRGVEWQDRHAQPEGCDRRHDLIYSVGAQDRGLSTKVGKGSPPLRLHGGDHECQILRGHW